MIRNIALRANVQCTATHRKAYDKMRIAHESMADPVFFLLIIYFTLNMTKMCPSAAPILTNAISRKE